LLLDTERVALQELFNMIRRFKVGYRVELHKRTLERGLLSLIGPASEQVAGAGDLPRYEHSHAAVQIEGVRARAIRTDTGVDLLCDATATEGLLGAVEARGAARVPESVTECLRVETGRPRYGVDLDETVIPQEAGLNPRAVSFTKGCYVGQETVARLHYRGKPNRRLRGLLLTGPSDRGAELRMGERIVGTLTTVASSPVFGSIGLALVRREAPPGTTVSVAEGGVTAEVVELPFER
jgi:folate-binding protein YgfZ